MASSSEPDYVECDKNSYHKVSIPLSEFMPSDLPKSHRSLYVWALIRAKALLTVGLAVKTTGPGAASCRDYSGGGCVVFVDSDTDKVLLTVQTAAHLGYDLGKEKTTTLISFFPGTGEVLKSSNVEVKTVSIVEDIAILLVIFDKHSSVYPKINLVLPVIQGALRADFDTLCQLVLEKYQKVSLSLSSFLNEIRCIKNLKCDSDTVDILEIELQVAKKYLIDVYLLISALVSHDNILLDLLRKIATGSDINTGTECSTVPVISTKLTQKTKILDSLKNALCQPLDENIMREVNGYLNLLFRFDISVQLKCRTVMIMRIGITNLSEGDGVPNGHDIEVMTVNMKARKEDDELNSGTQICVMLTNTLLDANKKNDEQIQGLFRAHIRSERQETKNNTLLMSEIPNAEIDEREDSVLVDRKMRKKTPGQVRSTLAVLISKLHDQHEPHVTLGEVKRRNGVEVFYTTPSCPGCSGAPVWLLTSSGAEPENIRFATHSASGTEGIGVLFILPDNQE